MVLPLQSIAEVRYIKVCKGTKKNEEIQFFGKNLLFFTYFRGKMDKFYACLTSKKSQSSSKVAGVMPSDRRFL